MRQDVPPEEYRQKIEGKRMRHENLLFDCKVLLKYYLALFEVKMKQTL